MSIAQIAERLRSAFRDGRLISGISRRVSSGIGRPRYDAAREIYWRAKLSHNSSQAKSVPLERAVAASQAFNAERPTRFVRDIEGMSGQRYRTLINTLIFELAGSARYLEIGSWKGSTLAAAIEGNRGRAVAIDNWSLFGGPKDEFSRNIEAIETDVELKIIEADFRAVDCSRLGGPFNVYMFDGPHEEADQYDGVMLMQPALANPHILIVDDWNWAHVRIGTFRAIHDAGWKIAHRTEIRTTSNDTHPIKFGGHSDWHNGYFIALLAR